MPGPSVRRDVKPHWRGRMVWRLLAVAGLLVGIGSLFRTQPAKVTARGIPQTPPSAEALASGYEIKDISARGVAYVLVTMAAATALVIGIVFAMVWRFDVNRNAASSRLTSEETAQIVPPAPHLQSDPFGDLARVQSRERRLLNGYGWINTDHSLAHIPIDRAMGLSVGKSLDASP